MGSGDGIFGMSLSKSPVQRWTAELGPDHRGAGLGRPRYGQRTEIALNTTLQAEHASIAP